MKLVLMAAAVAFAVPAMAQTTGDDQSQTAPDQSNMDQSGTTQDQSTMDQGTDQSGTMSQPGTMDQSGTTDQSGSMSNGGMSDGSTPAGGYQPSQPPMSGTAMPGAPVTFQQAQSPDQAYPAPAPLASYPMCKPGQTDQCMERENAAGQGIHHPRRRH